MRLGILADIHEHVAYLQAALARLRALEVDQLIVLGDVYAIGRHIHETVALLEVAGAVGVWGNHDIGLCREQSERISNKYAGPVLDYMSRLRPQLLVDDCYFSHVDAWLDPCDPMQLWWFGGDPVESGALQRSFDAVAHRHLSVGHYHRWMWLTSAGKADWAGDRPIVLDAPRNFVVVHAVCEGHAALYDTASRLLTPLALAD